MATARQEDAWTNRHTADEHTTVDYIWFRTQDNPIPQVYVNNMHWEIQGHFSFHAMLFTHLSLPEDDPYGT
jgi:hypothetical protein